ncbi:MAG: ferrous iron transport protein A [Thiolinea sp.]
MMSDAHAVLPLSLLAENRFGHVRIVQTDHPTRIRLLGIGIGAGSRLEVLRNRAGDMVLGQGNNRISLGHSITRNILVQAQG